MTSLVFLRAREPPGTFTAILCSQIDTKGEHNPIMQDTKKGKLRNYHGPLFWNYGAIPQTWEDPNVKHHEVPQT